MGKYADRFQRVLDHADQPVPGDRVRVTKRARNRKIRGKTGIVKRVWGCTIEIDGVDHHVNAGSLEIIDDE